MARDIDKVSEEIRESLKDSRVNNRSITTELQTSFIDYAMSVITSRALPDVRDGLKPVHRRILYAAYNLGMTSANPYKKSARLVGEVIGKYHPHGDAAVYEASVRMAQDFSLRYPLIDGHGNFGSIDGDGAAAMRYTEQRLSKITNELLEDIDKNTIDWAENYDGSEEEPTVLPSAFPNLLANGSTGIAVGMSTVIPPHNLSELIDASVHLAHNPEASIDELAEIIKGPDFPTYAQIVGTNGIRSYFHTGKGSVTIRSKYEIETHDNGKSTIIFTELPYMVTKSNLIERIVKLVREEVIEGINDLRDETSREGIRVIIETKKDVIPEIVLNKLFKHTELQTNVSVNMIALVGGVPKQLNIKECLHHFLEHQFDVLIRKVNFDLKKAKDRHHILQGIFNALHNIELVIEIIKGANDTKEAKDKLMANFQIDEIQADAILEMKLRTLSGMERNKVEEEMKKLEALIADYEETLKSKEKQTNIICENLNNIKNKYGDERRTEIIEGCSDIEDEELIPKEDVVITLSKNGYLKRIPVSTYRVQNRGGVGVLGLSTHNDDDVNLLITTNTHIDLLLFSDKGKVYRMRAHQIPQGSRQSKGMPALNLINIEKNENILTILPIDSYDEGFLFFVTKDGIVKRTPLSEFDSIKSNGKRAITLKEDDLLINVFKTFGNGEIYLGSTSGHLCRFKEEDVRVMGRTAAGVRGIRLVSESDYVIGSSSSDSGTLMLSIGENGFGKLSEISLYRLTKRGSKGVVSLKVNAKTGRMIFAKAIQGTENLLMLTTEGKINRISLEEFTPKGRSTSGVKLINMDDDVKLISASIFQNVDDEVEEPITETNNSQEQEVVLNEANEVEDTNTTLEPNTTEENGEE